MVHVATTIEDEEDEKDGKKRGEEEEEEEEGHTTTSTSTYQRLTVPALLQYVPLFHVVVRAPLARVSEF